MNRSRDPIEHRELLKNSEQSYATADNRIQQSLEVAAEARRALNYNYVYKAVRCQTE